MNNCNNNGCDDVYHSLPPCPLPSACVNPQPCSEVYPAECIVISLANITCGADVVIFQGNSIVGALENIVAYFCQRLVTLTTTVEDLSACCASIGDFVQSVTGLDTDNTDPQNPIVKISVDGTSITGLGTPASPLIATSGPFELGSTGNFSIKAINDTTVDAINDYAFAVGKDTKAAGLASSAAGQNTQAGWKGFAIDSVVNGLVTINSSYGNITSLFMSSYAYIYNGTGSLFYTYDPFDVVFTSPNTLIQLSDININNGLFIGDADNLNTALADQWLGEVSHTEGFLTKALGDFSHAEGNETKALGKNSHAEGDRTIATGNTSHAEGVATTASGSASHAEGGGTKATRDSSHAEGSSTVSSGIASHSEGYNTEASGNFGSHAEGSNTIASNNSAHAEGLSTTASGDYSHSEGWGTTAIGESSHAEGNGTVAGWQGFQIDDIVNGLVTINAADGNLTPYFTSGYVYINDYINNTIRYSVSSVLFTSPNTIIQLDDITVNAAAGTICDTNNTNNPLASINKGLNGHAEGLYSKAVGDNSHAEGVNSAAVGLSSHAEGNLTRALGVGSHAEGGGYSTASGDFSHAEGYGTTASGTRSHAEGSATIASGYSSHAEGEETNANGDYSHAEGFASISSGESSHAEGGNSLASGLISHAEGAFTISSGSYSHAEGQSSVSSGSTSHAEGYESLASGSVSHAEGFQTISSGDRSHAEGMETIASGYASHAGGNKSSTKGISARYSIGSSNGGDVGSSQLSIASVTGTTIDSVAAEMATISGTIIALPLLDNEAVRVKGSILGKQSTSINIAAYDFDCLIVRGVGAGTTVIRINTMTLAYDDIILTTIPLLIADTINGGLSLKSGGKGSTNIKWSARLDSVEVIN